MNTVDWFFLSLIVGLSVFQVFCIWKAATHAQAALKAGLSLKKGTGKS